jgi:hypothetical protein
MGHRTCPALLPNYWRIIYGAPKPSTFKFAETSIRSQAIKANIRAGQVCVSSINHPRPVVQNQHVNLSWMAYGDAIFLTCSDVRVGIPAVCWLSWHLHGLIRLQSHESTAQAGWQHSRWGMVETQAAFPLHARTANGPQAICHCCRYAAHGGLFGGLVPALWLTLSGPGHLGH